MFSWQIKAILTSDGRPLGECRMRALHVVSYEKFLPHIVEVAEAANPGKNRFVVLGATGKIPYQFTASVPCTSPKGPLWLDDVREHLQWCEALFLHPLNARSARAVEAAKPSTVVVWCGMGEDFYRYAPHFRDRLLLAQTRRAKRRTLFRRIFRKLRTSTLTAHLHRPARLLPGTDPVRRVAPRVNFFCSREQGLDLDRTLPGFRALQLGNFGYYTLERSLSVGADPVDGPDLLIGNSAFWSNNHFDVFEQLRRLDLDGRRIVLPLSYGEKHYADAVERRAARLFGRDRIVVLRDWIPIAEYNRTLSRCGFVFMNHARGQAMGNVSSMLLRGAKVYLRAENPYAGFYESLGVSFGRIGDAPFDSSVFAPLSAEEKARNASILRDYWGWPAVTERAAALFATVSDEVSRRNLATPLRDRPDTEQAVDGQVRVSGA